MRALFTFDEPLSPGVLTSIFQIVSAFIGWMVWGWINAVRGVARTAPLLYLVPPVAGLVAWATVGEVFGALKIAGALLALAGVAATQWVPRAVVADGDGRIRSAS